MPRARRLVFLGVLSMIFKVHIKSYRMGCRGNGIVEIEASTPVEAETKAELQYEQKQAEWVKETGGRRSCFGGATAEIPKDWVPPGVCQ